MKRYKHTLSHYRMVTGNMGELMPIACVPVLPGDTIQHHTNVLIRCSPLNTPVMHPVNVRVHHWFVPNRIIWPEWEQFITGGPDGDDQTPIPTLTMAGQKKHLAAYLGVPPIPGLEYISLPVRAYNHIFNQRYRDADLVPEAPTNGTILQKCAWEKDYASTARPWTQKGPDVTLPIGTAAPVFHPQGGGAQQVTVQDGARTDSWVRLLGTPNVTTGPGDQDESDRLYADLGDATAVAINDFRTGFALQRYQEARARYGSRFTEYLRYLGISPSDARLQEPEFLAGGQDRLNFSEVLQTANDDTADREGFGVGDLYGHGIAGVRTARYRKFFEEHGYVITLLSVRPKALYVNAVPREFIKKTKEDYFQKELAHIGQQEVYDTELYGDGDNANTVFGYQDRYHEYRSYPSQISQDFRDVLNAYHLGRDLAPNPVLNESFVECDPTDRIFQVGKDVGDTLWIMANNHVVARRLVPKRANPRIM